MTAPAIILTMIVRDEAHIIRRCIESVAGFVDGVYLHDTGSVDGTEIVARHAAQQAGLPINALSVPWRDFGTNRTQCIEGAAAQAQAASYGRAMYALMIDADEVLEGGIDRAALTADLYDIRTIMGGTSYWRPQLFRLDRGFTFKGVVHEYLVAPEGTTRSRLDSVVNRPHQDSARNRLGHEKYVLDAMTLRAALEDEPNPFLQARYTFYLAQCYRDAGDYERAQGWYEKRAKMGGWDQEVYCSLLHGGRMAEKNGHLAEAAEMWLLATRLGLDRVEADYHAIRYFRTTGSEEFARVLLMTALRKAVATDGLFVERWAGEVGLPAEAAALREAA